MAHASPLRNITPLVVCDTRPMLVNYAGCMSSTHSSESLLVRSWGVSIIREIYLRLATSVFTEKERRREGNKERICRRREEHIDNIINEERKFCTDESGVIAAVQFSLMHVH